MLKFDRIAMKSFSTGSYWTTSKTLLLSSIHQVKLKATCCGSVHSHADMSRDSSDARRFHV